MFARRHDAIKTVTSAVRLQEETGRVRPLVCGGCSHGAGREVEATPAAGSHCNVANLRQV